MNNSAPLFLIIGPLVAALVTLLTSRWQRVTAVIGVGAALVLWWRVRLFTDGAGGGSMFLYGRELLLTEGVRALVMFLVAGSGLLFLLACFFPQSRKFVPGTLAALVPLSVALMSRPFAFGVLLLPMAASILVVVIQADRAGSTQAAFRYMLFVLVAIPFWLVADWAMTTPGLTGAVNWLLALGIIILLAGFPCHMWINSLAKEASPLVSVLILGLIQTAMTVFVIRWLITAPWLSQDMPFNQLLRLSGAILLLVAGLQAITARQISRFLASLILLDGGMVLVALTLPESSGWQTAVSLHVVRFVSLLLTVLGLSLLQRRGVPDEIRALDSGRQMIFSLAIFAYGCLSLLGLPLTIGFGARWGVMTAVYQAAATNQAVAMPSWLPFLMLLAMTGGVIGLLRMLASFLVQSDAEATAVARIEARWLQGVLALTLAISLWLAASPQILLNYANELAGLLVS